MKKMIKQIPVLGDVAARVYWALRSHRRDPEPFPGTAAYWEKRYASGGNSGVGSYDRFAEFKAEVLNGFVARHRVRSVIEFGCGDGNQLGLARYPEYLGFDISRTAIARCQEMFASDRSKSFRMMSDYRGERADLALSLDVIYHLVEGDLFEGYMRTLFAAAERYVIVYASDTDDNRGYEGTYIKHRTFTRWIKQSLPAWRLIEHLPNRYPYRGDYRTGSFADFFIYESP